MLRLREYDNIDVDWSHIHEDIAVEIFKHAPIDECIKTISRVCKPWCFFIYPEDKTLFPHNKSNDRNILGNILLSKNNLAFEDQLNWKETYKIFLNTIFFIAIDFSESMNHEAPKSLKNKDPQITKLQLCKNKAKEVAETIIKAKGKLFGIKFREACNIKEISSIEEFINYFETPSKLPNGNNFEILYDTIIANDIQPVNLKKSGKSETELVNKFHKMEVTIFSDFDAHPSDLQVFKYKEIDLRLIQAGTPEHFNQFEIELTKILNSANHILFEEDGEEEVKTPQPSSKKPYDKIALKSFKVTEDEPLRPLKKVSLI